jgi:hypothetical protein
VGGWAIKKQSNRYQMTPSLTICKNKQKWIKHLTITWNYEATGRKHKINSLRLWNRQCVMCHLYRAEVSFSVLQQSRIAIVYKNLHYKISRRVWMFKHIEMVMLEMDMLIILLIITHFNVCQTVELYITF